MYYFIEFCVKNKKIIKKKLRIIHFGEFYGFIMNNLIYYER